MALKLLVPLERVQQVLGDFLVLDHPARCSRCDTVPAEFYETHKIRLRIGAKRPGLYRQGYRVNRQYYLRIRVCENCYQADFAAHPEEFERDDTSLGRLARTYDRLYMIGSLIAAVGILLMTNLVSSQSFLGPVKPYWPYITGPGMLIALGAWLHQRRRGSRILDGLDAAGLNAQQNPRARVLTPVLEQEDDPRAIPLEIILKNEEWAAECAVRYNLSIEKEGEE